MQSPSFPALNTSIVKYSILNRRCFSKCASTAGRRSPKRSSSTSFSHRLETTTLRDFFMLSVQWSGSCQESIKAICVIYTLIILCNICNSLAEMRIQPLTYRQQATFPHSLVIEGRYNIIQLRRRVRRIRKLLRNHFRATKKSPGTKPDSWKHDRILFGSVARSASDANTSF